LQSLLSEKKHQAIANVNFYHLGILDFCYVQIPPIFVRTLDVIICVGNSRRGK